MNCSLPRSTSRSSALACRSRASSSVSLPCWCQAFRHMLRAYSSSPTSSSTTQNPSARKRRATGSPNQPIPGKVAGNR